MKRNYLLTDTTGSYAIRSAESAKEALATYKRWTKAKLMPKSGVTEIMMTASYRKRATASNDGHYYRVSWFAKVDNKRTGRSQWISRGSRKFTSLAKAQKLAAS